MVQRMLYVSIYSMNSMSRLCFQTVVNNNICTVWDIHCKNMILTPFIFLKNVHLCRLWVIRQQVCGLGWFGVVTYLMCRERSVGPSKTYFWLMSNLFKALVIMIPDTAKSWKVFSFSGSGCMINNKFIINKLICHWRKSDDDNPSNVLT